MPAWVHIVRNVEAFMVLRFGIVNGVLLPSGFFLSNEMCSFSLIMQNPNLSSALTTLRLGASTGNFFI